MHSYWYELSGDVESVLQEAGNISLFSPPARFLPSGRYAARARDIMDWLEIVLYITYHVTLQFV